MIKLLLSAFALLMPLSAFAADNGQYRVESKILLLDDTDALVVRGDNVTAYQSGKDQAGTAFQVFSGKTDFLSDNKEPLLSINKATLDFTAAEKKGVITLLSAPTIVAPSGAEACIEIKQDGDSIQYFEKNADGGYQLKSLPPTDWLGTELNVIIDGPRSTVSLQVDIRNQAQRIKIENVNLDVGRPMLETRRINLSPIKYKESNWVLVVSPKQNNKKLLIAFKIDKEAPTTLENAAPKPQPKEDKADYK